MGNPVAILSKACKSVNFELHNSLKLGFRNTEDVGSSFVDCQSFFEANSSDILALYEQSWMTQLILAISL